MWRGHQRGDASPQQRRRHMRPDMPLRTRGSFEVAGALAALVDSPRRIRHAQAVENRCILPQLTFCWAFEFSWGAVPTGMPCFGQ